MLLDKRVASKQMNNRVDSIHYSLIMIITLNVKISLVVITIAARDTLVVRKVTMVNVTLNVKFVRLQSYLKYGVTIKAKYGQSKNA